MYRGGGGAYGNAAITSGSITGVSGVLYDLAHYAIPIVNAGSGSMANNGAVTFTTSIGVTYANAYVLLPAGAIAAGVPASADYYYVQMSSGTVGTVFNNTLSANVDSFGGPTIPASPTAFVTTGPGAFAAATTATTMLTFVLPASTIGATGRLLISAEWVPTSNANAKNVAVNFGATAVASNSPTSTAAALTMIEVVNRNSASVQSITNTFINVSSIAHGAAYGTNNTGSSVNIVFQSTHSGAATDHIALEHLRISALK